MAKIPTQKELYDIAEAFVSAIAMGYDFSFVKTGQTYYFSKPKKA